MHSQLRRHRHRRSGRQGHPGRGARVRRRQPRGGAPATGRPGDRQGDGPEGLRVRHRPARQRDRRAKAKAGLVSTTAGVDRPFGPPLEFRVADDRAPASALDLAQAADYLERITKALEKLARHEHVPWDRPYSITVQGGSTYTIVAPNNVSGFVVANQTGQILYARLGEFCNASDYDVIVPNNHVARYERKDWEGNYLTFFNPGGAPVTFNVLVGRPVPELTLVAI